MEKDLSKMTNEELWQLFPIVISEHKTYWKNYYEQEESFLKGTLGTAILRINHIGSTAVPGLPAKPTIDILLEINNFTNTNRLILDMEKAGYIYSPQPEKPAPHMMFLKGYTPQGFAEKVYHVHVRYSGDWDELYFKNYLITHPEAAREYGLLKLQLKKQFEHDRDAYTSAKTDFIKEIVRKSRTE